MGASEKTQHAIRRSTRLPLEVPVLVNSLDPSVPFSEECRTTLVNAHGCGVIAPREIARGLRVRMEIVSAKRHTTARVAEIVALGGNPETWLVGLELDVPGNFWGIDFAPSDWKFVEFAAPAPEPSRDQQTTAAGKSVPSRRWRLTDISEGACYLETATPFPASSPVLLSVRVLESECLLEGTVRISHPETGMGVEFTEEPAAIRRSRVEELVGRLKSHREVPKIFVGRREAGKKSPKADSPSPTPPDSAARNDETSDPLLQLVREGPSLTTEQFLNDLRAQRLGKRRDPRIDLVLPVLLTGTDVGGRPLDQRVVTVNISRRGAMLEGIHGMLQAGDQIFLERLHHREQFRVAWVTGDAAMPSGKIGVAAVDPNTSFWSDVLETIVQSRLEMASLRSSRAQQSSGTDH